jgi:hypothetical protein
MQVFFAFFILKKAGQNTKKQRKTAVLGKILKPIT